MSITGNGGEDQHPGDWKTCPHCEGTGERQGPGGKEPCCHCRGEGEIWLDDDDWMDTGEGDIDE